MVRAAKPGLSWKEDFERGAAPRTPTRTHLLRWSLSAAAPCTAALMFLFPPVKREQVALTSGEVLRGVRTFQAEIDRKPGMLYQVLRVEVVETRPVTP